MKLINEWTDKPTGIKSWPSDVEYVMFVDESGNSDITNILKLLNKRKEIDINDKYFTITGCIFTKNDYAFAQKEIENLKNKYWNNGCWEYKGKLQKVCLHSREIRRREGPFR